MFISLVAIPLLAYLAMLSFLYLFQRHLLYLPDRSPPQLGGLVTLGVHQVRLITADGLSLLSWYLPPHEGRPMVAYFHGNGGHVGYRADRLRRFAAEGYGVAMVEYRGYGGNPGSPSEAGLYTDARAALDFIEGQGIAGYRIVLYGESLGTAIAVRMAVEYTIGAAVLESPFTSIAAVAQYHYPYVPVRPLIWDRFDVRSLIGEVSVPILMLQGGDDPIVPTRFGRALFDAAPEPKEMWLAPEGEHEDLARFGALDAAVAFIERHLRS